MRTAALAALTATLCAVSVIGFAQAPVCAVTDAGHRLPDADACLADHGIALSTSSPSEAASALFAHVETRIAAGHFDEADRTLDCAAAVLNGHGDALMGYELVRRRGILDYRRERIAEALSRFECALDMARARKDRVAIARDLKNVGSALRRLGDYQGALDALIESLALQRAEGEPSGLVLRNIADVYREIGESSEAMRRYRDALTAFRKADDRVEAGHTLETMSLLALDAGDGAQAQRWLEEALRIYHDAGHNAYRLRVYAGLIRVALARGIIADAQAWRNASLAAANEYGLPLPAPLQLQIARLDRASGRLDSAENRIRDAVARLPEGDADRVSLLEELANVHQSQGDYAAAIETMRRLRDAEQTQERSRHDRQMGWLRTRFETAERDRRITALEHENRARSLTLWLISVSAIAVLSILSLLFLRWRQRERLAEVARKTEFENELARYRSEADALAEDRFLLQTLLDSRNEAICLLDADGTTLAANRGACALLGSDRGALVGRALVETRCGALDEAGAQSLSSALDRMQDSAIQTIVFAATDAHPAFRAELRHWEQGDGLIVLTLHDADTATTDTPDTIADLEGEAPVSADTIPDQDGKTPTPADRATDVDFARREFRQALVTLMLETIEAWESATGTSRIELAEKSRIWRVNIDDGRLRARVMERYLSLSKLPQNPRWRDVVRSAYFVLGHAQMDADARAALKRGIDVVLAYTRRSALV